MTVFNGKPWGSINSPVYPVSPDQLIVDPGVAAAFQLNLTTNGLNQLSDSITINGVTNTPTIRYKGGDADATDWDAWAYGTTLTRQAGTAPTYNFGAPFLDANSDSVRFNGGNRYQAGDNTTGEFTNEDMVFEVVFQYNGDGKVIAAKRSGSTGAAWLLYITGLGQIALRLDDGSNVAETTSGTGLVTDAWYHAMAFADRSGSARIFLNGVGGTAASISAVGDISVAAPMTIGSYSNGVIPFESAVAYVAAWGSDNWLDTHDQAAVASERFVKLAGVFAQFTASQSPSYFQPTNSTTTVGGQVYRVPAGWPRVQENGYLSEITSTNLCLQSEDFSTTWTLDDATLSTDVETAPDNLDTADGVIASAVESDHFVNQSISLTSGTTYTFSTYAKAADKDWIQMEISTGPTVSVYFDVANGTVGTTSGTIVHTFIESLNNGWYRCGFSAEMTSTGAKDCRIYSAEADNDNSFTGDGATIDTYLWGAQVEASHVASSYIPTTTASVQRDRELMAFLVDTFADTKSTINLDHISQLSDFESGSMATWVVGFSDGTANNIVALLSDGTDTTHSARVVDGGSTEADLTFDNSTFDGSSHAVVISSRANNVETKLDGSLDPAAGNPDTSVTMPSGMNLLYIGSHPTAADAGRGWVKNLKILD